jgi:outer membrane protein
VNHRQRIVGRAESTRRADLGRLASPGGLAILAGLAATAAGLMGCSGGPLGERDSDRGERVSLSRLRDVQRLSLDQFKSEPMPEPAAASPDASSGIPPELQRPPSRFAGQSEVTMTLEQARAEAIRNNLELKVALVDPAIAGETLRAEQAKFEAVFRPFVRFNHNEPATTNITVNNQSESWQYGGTVDIPLRTGGRASVGLTQARFATVPSFFNPIPVYYTQGFDFSISQPLLRNGGRTVNTTSIQIAGYQEQIVQARTKLVVIAQLANVERSYWRLYAAREALKVAQQQYELAVTQLQQAQRRVRAGQSPELEITRAESGVASRLEAIVQAENSVLIQQRELKLRMNASDLDIAGREMLVPGTLPNATSYAVEPDALMSMALGERMELLETELQILADAANERLARNQVLPLLDLGATYSIDGIGESFNRAQSSGLGQRDFQSWSFVAQGEIPLGNEAAEARLRRAVLTRAQRLATKQVREQTVRQDVLDSVDRLRAAWQRILAAREASILAGRVLQGEQRQFEVGQRTSTDVLDAATRLADAQVSEIRAITEYQIAQVDLAVATGTVLGAAGVSWAPNADVSNVPSSNSTGSPLAPSLLDDRK